MSDENNGGVEKDYFWVYIGVLVVVIVGVLLVVRGSEHEKYATVAKAIQESNEYSAYK